MAGKKNIEDQLRSELAELKNLVKTQQKKITDLEARKETGAGSGSKDLQATSQLQALMDSLPDRIYFKDKECRFTLCNKACAIKNKLDDPAQLVGKTDFDFFPEEMAREWMKQEKQIMKTGEPIIGREYLDPRESEEGNWISTTKIPLKDDKGKIIGVYGVSRDISRTKRAAQQLQTLMDNLPDRIYFKDKDCRFTLVNMSCALKHNLKDPSEAVGKSDLDFFPEETAREWMDQEKQIMKTGVPLISSEYLEPGDGTEDSWISTTKMPWRDEEGRIIGVYGVSRNITRAKRVEQQLKALMDNLPDAIYFKDTESRFTLVNKACARGFGGFAPEEIVGKTDYDFFNAIHAQPAFDDEKKIMSTGEPIIGKEELELKPDGSETWVNTTKMPLKNKNNEIIGTFGVSRDITLLKKAELHLKILMDNIPDAIYFKDLKSRFTLINKACAEGFELNSPEEAIGKSDFDFFSRPHAQPAFNDEQKIIKTGKPMIGIEELETWEDGSERWVMSTKLPLKDNLGNIIGTFGLTRDIDRLKQAEAKLQQYNEELEKIVQQRTAELRKANQAMQVRIQQLDYLNRKAHFFTQLIDRDTLLPVIFYAFAERIKKGELHLCEVGEGQLNTVYQSDGLKDENTIKGCLQALEHLDAGTENIVFEKNWTKNSQLKGILDESLKKYPCYMVIPLSIEKKLRGAVQIFVPNEYQEVYEEENMLLSTLASQAAISLDNANNYRELNERARIQSELEIAHSIQKRFTPEDPTIPDFKIKGICRPANEVGGDYLDFFQNNHGDWVLVIADVCGKGIPAVLVMTSLRSVVRAEARDKRSSKDLLNSVNSLLGKELQADNSFITCMALIIDRKGKTMNFTRAGHPMLVGYREERQPEKIRSNGIALGMLLGDAFNHVVEEVKLDLLSGDKFLAYTDGLDEAMNVGKETYGVDRLFRLLNNERGLRPAELVDNILSDIEAFCKGYRQSDDLTLFALEKL